MENLSMASLERMKNVDVETVDRAALADINDVEIDASLPKWERILDYIRQIKNPYCYKCGETVVKSTFDDPDHSLEDRLEGFMQML